MSSQTLLVLPFGGTPRQVATAVNAALKGKLNCRSTFTLGTGVTSTTVDDILIGANSVVLVAPQSAHAAALLTGLYIDPADYTSGTSFVVRHASTANADCTFGYMIIGG